MSRDELDLAVLARRVVANPGVDVRGEPGFTSDHAALLRDIDNIATVVELISTWGRLGATRALAALVDLHRWGACRLADDVDPGVLARATAAPVEEPPPVEAPTPVEEPAASAAARVDDGVDLDPEVRRRIEDAAGLLREGRVLELLGVAPGADRAELKRAYYALSKEFHPDRFYGRQLGDYAPMLSQVFEAAAQAVKTLLDPRTVVGERPGATPQRRRSPRYSYTSPLRLRCESWPEPRWLTLRQVGAGGMFVASDHPAGIGERVAFELTLPDRTPLVMSGRIVNRLEAAGGRPAGLCIQFAPLPDAERARFGALLDAARAGAPAPATGAEPPIDARTRFARGSGSHPTTPPIIGIDLGTTYVSVSAQVGGRVHVLPFPDGRRSLPSVVAFPRRGEVVVGAPALDRLVRDPRHTVASAKRLLGRLATDREIQGQLASAGYQTLSGPGGELLLEMWGEPLAIPQICAHLLDAARAAAERVLGQAVGGAVLTAPVEFGADRIELLRRAARLAHLDVIDVIDEPSAAALANRFRPEFGGLVGVYDFGGGTFDFSVVDASGGDFKIVTTAGDSWLGGDDFDLAIAEALAELFWKASGLDLRQRAVEWQLLLRAVEQAKRDLSTADLTRLDVPDVLRTADGMRGLHARLQRGQAEQLWAPLIERSMHTCVQALTLVGLTPRDLSAIYLSGGTTHIPLVRDAIVRRFGSSPVTGVPADYAVCLGAGVQAAQLEQLRDPTLPTSASAAGQLK